MPLELVLETDIETTTLSQFLKVAEAAIEYCNLKNYEISLLLCDDEKIGELNSKWRSINSPTDVLSFPMQNKKLSIPLNPESTELFPTSEQNPSPEIEPSLHTLNIPPLEDDTYLLGDIAISVDTAARQAAEINISLLDELSILFIHGLLHLCGYDHIEESDFIEMREKEIEILSACLKKEITPLLKR